MWNADQDRALAELTNQLEEETHQTALHQANKILFLIRAVIIQQEVDQIRAFIMDWACHGPAGKNMPNNIPLTGAQAREIDERLKRIAVLKGIRIDSVPIPSPPLHAGIHPSAGRQPPDLQPKQHPPERSDWSAQLERAFNQVANSLAPEMQLRLIKASYAPTTRTPFAFAFRTHQA